MLDHMLSLYLIIGSKHNRNAFPKNLHLALCFALDRRVLYVVECGIAVTGCVSFSKGFIPTLPLLLLLLLLLILSFVSCYSLLEEPPNMYATAVESVWYDIDVFRRGIRILCYFSVLYHKVSK